jgi:beta-glucosidase
MTIQEYIDKLSLEEKAALLQGKTPWTTWDVPRLLLPSMFLADGPHGMRRQAGSEDHLGLNASEPATCFPTASTMACSWDPALGEELGQALGREAAASDVHVVLGPGLNLQRSPLCGRNFEYFSEDPYLSGKMAAGYVRGIQSRGVAACLKHFAANSQEDGRMSVDSVVDERTLRELYLTGFEIAVKEGRAKAVMSAYNKVNGTYADEDPKLLTDILRREWGFDGFVVSDWGACNDPVAAIEAGSALNMPDPGLGNAHRVCQAVREGRLPESKLDDRLRELLPLVLATRKTVAASPKTFDREAHHDLARRCAEGSAVLLENDGILPLSGADRVALIGDYATTPRYQGEGSSKVNATRVDTLAQALRQAGADLVCAQGFRADGKKERRLIDEAVEAARQAKVAVLCVGSDPLADREGQDRNGLDLPVAQQKLIRAVGNVNPNVVLVVFGGGPVLVPQGCRAVLYVGLSGQAGATAMADILLGKVSPSGHLAQSWPERLEDLPCHRYYGKRGPTAQYREGLYVGYRYFETVDKPVRYPFGHGLSYTTFRYADLTVDRGSVSFTLTNTGDMDGAEVAQVYIGATTGKVFRPKRELKAFQKVFLKAGETKKVQIPLDETAFRYYNVNTGKWEMETAHYTVSVGGSVRDLRLNATVRLIGTDAPCPYGAMPSYDTGTVTDVPDYEFTALLGREIPADQWPAQIGINDPLWRSREAASGFFRWLYRRLDHRVRKKQDLNVLFVLNMPIRAMAQMTRGKISHAMTEDILHMVNGHFWAALPRLIRGWTTARKIRRDYDKELRYGPRE